MQNIFEIDTQSSNILILPVVQKRIYGNLLSQNHQPNDFREEENQGLLFSEIQQILTSKTKNESHLRYDLRRAQLHPERQLNTGKIQHIILKKLNSELIQTQKSRL